MFTNTGAFDISSTERFDVSRRLELGERVARGGDSDVYKGWLGTNEGGIKVAIKELRISSHVPEDRFQKHFLREVKAWSELQSSHILPFLGYSKESGGTPRLVSPWCENGDLQKYIRSNPEANRRQLLIDVLKGMQYIEFRGLVHGDLKCGNILVNDRGNACLCDFGTTRLIEGITGFTTTSLNGKATLRFMAPERLMEDKPPTTASDIWAFGCVVIEVFTGKPPYPHISYEKAVISEIITKVLPLDPAYYKVTTPGDQFWAFISKCWGFQPISRPGIVDLLEYFLSMSEERPYDQENLTNRACPMMGGTIPQTSIRFYTFLEKFIKVYNLPELRYSAISDGPAHAEQWTVNLTVFVPYCTPCTDRELLYKAQEYRATSSSKRKAEDEAAREAIVHGLNIDISTLADIDIDAFPDHQFRGDLCQYMLTLKLPALGGPSSLRGSTDPHTLSYSNSSAAAASPSTQNAPSGPLHRSSGVTEAINNVASSRVQGRVSKGPPLQTPPTRRQPPRTVWQRIRFFFSSRNNEARKRIANVIRVCIGSLEVVTIVVVSIRSATKWKSKSDKNLSEWEACTNPVGTWNALWAARVTLAIVLGICEIIRDWRRDQQASNNPSRQADLESSGGSQNAIPQNDGYTQPALRNSTKPQASPQQQPRNSNIIFNWLETFVTALGIGHFVVNHILLYGSLQSCRFESPHVWWLGFGILCLGYLVVTEILLIAFIVFILGPLVLFSLNVIILCLHRVKSSCFRVLAGFLHTVWNLLDGI
ncbi:hypothetical protein FRC03_009982 [Tulasnella sp. 419]|nr:hypothetical protein FRC02_010356 [Tulasnella sp. 418]KAG8957605.1 hypothetical protein FRC03_009982 [Tulasnella sp. 419]